MPASPTARSVLLPGAEAPNQSYGAVSAASGVAGLQRPLPDVERPATPDQAANDTTAIPSGGAEAKSHRPFREIAAVCLGLWTSVYCAALSGSVTANLQTDISSHFKAGHLASWYVS